MTRPGRHPLLGSKWGQFPRPISLKWLHKKTPLVQFVAMLEIRIILKNEPNRFILKGVIAKQGTVPNDPNDPFRVLFRVINVKNINCYK